LNWLVIERGILEIYSTSYEISAADISAARQAAKTLSQFNVAGEVEFDAAGLVSGELNPSDFTAAKQAANYLVEADRVSHEISAADISAARLTANYLAAASQVSGELDVDDIAAAREAAQTLSHTFIAGGVDLQNPAFDRTAAELELARRFGAPGKQLTITISAE